MDEKIRYLTEMADFKQTVVDETVNTCLEIIANMPPHCAYTTYQVDIVNCVKNQAITEIKKAFERTKNELVTP